MADVGVGERVAAYGRHRSKVVKDAVRDNHPALKATEDAGGVVRVKGGRTYLDESLSGQNSSVGYIGEVGQVPINNYKAVDSPEASWTYLAGSVTLSKAEQLMNRGQGRFIDIYAAKQDALEGSMMNVHHGGFLSSGTGTSGLQLDGMAAAISTTPTTGTYNTIDRSSSNAAWFRNSKFDSAGDWTLGAVDAGNVKKFFDKLINNTTKDGKCQLDYFLAGSTHFEFLTDAIGALQTIQNQNANGHAGFQKLTYRGVPVYFGGGVTYSSQTALTATRTYGVCAKKGGFNLVYMDGAEFDMMPKVDSADQAAFSSLMLTMATTSIGAFAKLCIVGFD